MEHIVKIISVTKVTHNVRQFNLEKPDGFHFNPGQATDVSINEAKWKDELRPFTFTCLNNDPYLQFTIKIYTDHSGVTNRLGELKTGDELIIRDVWGAIEYKGPGYFIAGGAGITPFIAILRQLREDGELAGNTLFFSNQTDQDIILENELKAMPGLDIIFTTTKQKDGKNDHRKIDIDFLKTEVKDFNKHFYVCGPDQMVLDVSKALESSGAKPDAVVFEK
ncbi:MAG: oxidoreductase FAD/NAD(P)-binding domain protein [Mucilaginibacter sp.]|nr:oxidoreductase FAD/NAD(P)-binding domain protein [Mucilaginibacter sp.]